MGIKKLTPTSPARRYQTYLTRDELTVGAVPEKSLLEPKTRISGRNNDGRIRPSTLRFWFLFFAPSFPRIHVFLVRPSR